MNNTVTLRGGWDYGSHPLGTNRAFGDIAFTALTEHHFAVGVGWQANQAAQPKLGFMWAPEVSISGSNLNQGIASYETGLTEYSIEFGVSWKFWGGAAGDGQRHHNPGKHC